MNAEWQHEKYRMQNEDMPGYEIEVLMPQIKCHECGVSSMAFVPGGCVRFCPNCGAELRFPRHMMTHETQRFELVLIKETWNTERDEAERQREPG